MTGGAKLILEEMTWQEVAEASRANSIIVIPTGSIEQHGPHLPLMVDACIATEVARAAVIRVAEPSLAIVAPAIHIGCSEEHLEFAGSLSVSSSVFIATAKSIVLNLARHGFTRFLFLNGHAGNMDALRLAVREIRQEREVMAAASSYWQLAAQEMIGARTRPGGGMTHGGEEETSLMLHLRPELVDMSKAVPNSYVPKTRYLSGDLMRDAPVSYGRKRGDIAPLGNNGDPTRATPEHGRQLFEIITQAVANFLLDFSRWQLRSIDEN